MLRIVALLLFLAPLGCSVAPAGDDAAEATTDGGTWTLSVDPVQVALGWNDLAITIRDADDAIVQGLEVDADLQMPSMGHGSSEPVTTTEQGDGVYVVRGYFQMSGAWLLEGTVTDAASSEAFAVDVEAVE